MKATVIDYGLGNLHSVAKALKHAGADVLVSSSPADLRAAERLVLPGVGAFADGMSGLRQRHLVDPIKDFIATGRPFLGICLGMQLLMSESSEFGRHLGLGLVPGPVEHIGRSPGLKIPQIGWNRIAPREGGTWTGTIFESVTPGTMFYFVHSFTAQPERDEDRLADSDYGGNRISAAIQRDNVLGCQFHPEKSGTAGLALLRRFLEPCAT